MKTNVNVWRLIGVVLMMTMSASLWAQNSGEIPVPLTDPAKRGKLKAHINTGSITVRGTARKDVLVKYSGEDEDDDHDRKKGEKAGLKKIGGGTLDLEISENANSVKVTSNSWNNKVSLDIEVPSGMDVEMYTYNDGDLLVTGIQGEVVLTNYNGEITAENISGSVVSNTYNGEIKVTFDKVTEGAPMSFISYNGDVDLTFPSTFKATLKMKTQQGEILSGFDFVALPSSPKKLESKSGTFKVVIDEWVMGNINGGGAECTMKTYNGDIVLRKK